MKHLLVKTFSLLLAVMLLLPVFSVVSFAEGTEPAVEVDTTGALVMTPGASIRTKEDWGIRFEAKVSQSLIDANGGADRVRVGMLFAPTDRIGNGDFTESAFSNPDDFRKFPSTGWFKTENDVNIFRMSLTEIPETDKAVMTRLSARAYMEILDAEGNVTKTIYSPYNSADNSRSLGDAAVTLIEEQDTYDDNEIVKNIYAKVPEMFSYVQEGENLHDTLKYTSLKKGSFAFDGDIYKAGADYYGYARVQTTAVVYPGDTIEFDYEWLAGCDGNGDEGVFAAMLAKTDADMKDTWNAIYSSALFLKYYNSTCNAAKYSILPPREDGRYYIPFTGDAGQKGMAENVKRYHISINLSADGKQATYTIQELGDTCNSYQETVDMRRYWDWNFTSEGVIDAKGARLVFCSQMLGYKVSNVQVTEDTAWASSSFSYLQGTSSVKWSTYPYLQNASYGPVAILHGDDSFKFNEDYAMDNDPNWINYLKVQTNVPLKKGQKVEFDYTSLKVNSAVTQREAWIWLKDADKPFADHWWEIGNNKEHQVYGTLRFDYDADGQSNKGTVSNQPDLGKAVVNNEKAAGNYHITIELIEQDGKAQVKYTITEIGVENPSTYTMTVDCEQTSFTDNLILVFGARGVAYRISNYKII